MLKRMAEILARVEEIGKEVRAGNVSDELNKELDALLAEKAELEKKQQDLNEKVKSMRKVNIVEDARTENALDTVEYRNAFRDYVCRRNKKVLEYRIDVTTETTDVGAVIPTTIMQRVIDALQDYGDILSRVTFINVQGGVRIPVAGVKPVATWVTEGSVADKQKQEIDDSVIFSYFKLQIRIAITLIAATVSLDLWEQKVAENITAAMGSALEAAVISGAGSTEPLGIINDLDLGAGEGRIPVANQVNFADTDATYDGWIAKLFSSMPLAYRKKPGSVVIMNPVTFDKYIWGLVDEEGHPIARVNYGLASGPEYRVFGKEVILTELLPDLDTASATDVVVLHLHLDEYMFNTNLQLVYRQYFDEDTDEFIRKATLIADGKLADTNGVIVLKKAS